MIQALTLALATRRGRESSLQETLESLLPQADKVHIYLNGFTNRPGFLVDERIVTHLGPDIGDAGKFFWVNDAAGFYFTVDDDIVYPPDYVERMVHEVERLGRRAAVAVHGALFVRMPIDDYYSDRTVFHYRQGLPRPRPVHVAGTGTLCWHTSAIKVSKADFPVPNMADVWFAIKAQQGGLPLACIDRPPGWLQDTSCADPNDSIWGTRSTATEQTNAVNDFGRWRLLPLPGPSVDAAGNDPSFTVLVTAHNIARFAGECLRSIASQTWRDWRVVFVDDASVDGTADAVERLASELGIADRVTVVAHDVRRYKTRNVIDAVREMVADDEIVVMVDGDDWLAHDQVLVRLAESYAQGWDVVWGNWTGSDGCAGWSWHLCPFTPPRQHSWVSGHLFSFRAGLLKSLPDAEFLDDHGEWFRCACDQAIALPILERTIRRKHIEEVLYVYNRTNPNSHDRQGPRVTPLVSQAQAEASKVLYSRPPSQPMWDDAFYRSHRFDFVHAAMASAQRFGGDIARQRVRSELARLDGMTGQNT